MSKKKPDTHAEDVLFVAERQYKRMMDNVNKGIVDRDEIGRAIDSINNAHRICLKDKKEHLIK